MIKEFLNDLNLDKTGKKYYDGFDTSIYGDSLAPGSAPADELYKQWISLYKPNLVIEVGSFLGYSAINMAKEIKKLNLDTKIICVDTWLGSPEHYINFKETNNDVLNYTNGYPTLYHKFISNVILNNVQDIIYPFPFPSSIAFKILDKLFNKHNIKADFIFIDGSHEELDVHLDLYYYYQLLSDKGVMWGDDWGWDMVKNGVNSFLQENKLEHNFNLLENKIHWFIEKNNLI
jgi:hypothetical protein